MERNTQQLNAQRHILAIARWEDNQEEWLEGNYLRLISKSRRLQQRVGEGGTLWIVVSRPKSDGGRLYSLSFRLNNCRMETYAHETQYGRHAVVGDPTQSTVFAPNDATLLLLSLRFDPYRPIKNIRKIGYSIRSPRHLNKLDIQLLEKYSEVPDRWRVFISYQSKPVRQKFTLFYY